MGMGHALMMSTHGGGLPQKNLMLANWGVGKVLEMLTIGMGSLYLQTSYTRCPSDQKRIDAGA